jgi:hypothetical protein
MMTKIGTWIRVAMMAVVLAGAPALPSAQTPAQEGFVPVDQLPGQEELPAAPLVAGAYAIAWAAVLIYLFSIWRRLAAVEREMADVARRVSAGNR